MPNSSVTIIFDSMPLVGDTLNFRDSSRNINLNQVFRSSRSGAGQTAIPQLGLNEYSMTYSESENTNNIGVSYNDGTFKIVPFGSLMTNYNGDGTLTISILSKFTPSIVDLLTNNAIVWPGGNFNFVKESYNGYISNNYANAFNLDYNQSNLFTVRDIVHSVPPGTGLGALIIEANYPNAVFELDEVSPNIRVIINNVVDDPFILVGSNNGISAADSNQCDNIKLTLETNELAKTVLINNQIITTDNNDNPVVLNLLRGTNYYVELRRESRGSRLSIRYPQSSSYFNYPRLIDSNFDIRVKNTLAGSTITILKNFPTGSNDLDLEYSIDGITWTTTNSFSGLTSGNYNIHVRDSQAEGSLNLGCSIIIEVIIDDFGYRKPYAEISKANSINYALLENVDNCNIFRNDKNSLSYQSLSSNKYCDEVLLAKCDAPVTQIHSNYRNVTAMLRDFNGNDVMMLNMIKRSNNLNRYQSMDAYMYRYQPGVSAIYFDTGNTYDEFGNVSGSYSLLGNFPDMVKIGGIIEVKDLEVFEIVDTIFDFEKNKKAFLINYDFNSDLTELIIVSSLYDLLDFEVYEFELNCLFLQNGVYDILVTNSNSPSDEKLFLSENIFVDDDHTNTLFIQYFGKNNRDIFYKYGIRNLIRMRYQNVVMNIVDEIETLTTDDSTSVIKSTVKDGNTFIFDEVPRDFAFKLIIALSMEYVFINNEGYAKRNEISVEPIENTNLYKLTADMVKTNASYSNIGKEEDFVDIDTGVPITFPRIITDGTNFIKA